MDTLFYRNTRLLVLVICLVLVAGVSSYLVLPRMEDPALTEMWLRQVQRDPGEFLATKFYMQLQADSPAEDTP